MIENKKEFKLISKKNPKSLLPNTLTIFGVCLGLSSIKFAIDLNYSMAVIAIGFAAILDTLDGRVARLIKGSSIVYWDGQLWLKWFFNHKVNQKVQFDYEHQDKQRALVLVQNLKKKVR